MNVLVLLFVLLGFAMSFFSSSTSFCSGGEKQAIQQAAGSRGWVLLPSPPGFQLSGPSFGIELQELIPLSHHSPHLQVLDHDAVGNAIGFQEGFDCLEAGEGHPQVSRVARAGRVTPEINLVWRRELSPILCWCSSTELHSTERGKKVFEQVLGTHTGIRMGQRHRIPGWKGLRIIVSELSRQSMTKTGCPSTLTSSVLKFIQVKTNAMTFLTRILNLDMTMLQ